MRSMQYKLESWELSQHLLEDTRKNPRPDRQCTYNVT